MNIILNNRPDEFDLEEMTVEQMLQIKKFSFKMRVVKINGQYIRKENYSTSIIKDGDNVQMLYLMSGG
jgi:sulfur carrier protein